MSRCILIYGQPASGKSYSLRNLDPSTTYIFDADLKGTMPWRGSRTQYSRANRNFFTAADLNENDDLLPKILGAIRNIGSNENWKHINTLVIDGLNNAMANDVYLYEDAHKSTNKFEKYDDFAKMMLRLVNAAQRVQRDDLTIVFIAHVETADPYAPNDVDKLLTPGKFLKDKIKLESKFNYVFYAKNDGENFFFEVAPKKSTARAPHGCFDEPQVPNDLNAIIARIDAFEKGD